MHKARDLPEQLRLSFEASTLNEPAAMLCKAPGGSNVVPFELRRAARLPKAAFDQNDRDSKILESVLARAHKLGW